MDGRKDLLIIFSRAPIAGFVKTRMFPHLSFDEAADLQTAFLLDVVESALACVGREVCLAFTPPGALGVFMGMLGGRGLRFNPQEGDDLGARMHNAFLCAFGEGAGKAVVMGSDIPTITPSHIDAAFDALDTHDMSICPTEDGGYCLIGLKGPAPDLFTGVQWSTHGVFDATMSLARLLGLSVKVLPRLVDVDTIEDLAGMARSELPRNTGLMVERLRPRLENDNGWLV